MDTHATSRRVPQAKSYVDGNASAPSAALPRKGRRGAAYYSIGRSRWEPVGAGHPHNAIRVTIRVVGGDTPSHPSNTCFLIKNQNSDAWKLPRRFYLEYINL
jgi:hypothetical protein